MPLNLSLLSLKVSSYANSPYIAGGSAVTVADVRASSFFSNFLHSKASSFVHRSYFASFLDTALVIRSMSYYSGYYSSTLTISSVDANITDSFFVSCSSSGTGGAICFTTGSFYLYRSTFLTCYSTANFGGAIHATVTSSLVSRCCGYGCYTPTAGQFFRIIMSSTSSTDSINITLTSAHLCNPSQLSGSFETMIIFRGVNRFSYCNSSFNYVATYRAGFAPDSLIEDDVSYCTCASNVGQSTLRIISYVGYVDHVNMYNNSGHSSTELVEVSGTNTFTLCNFIGNAAPIFGGSGTSTCINCAFTNSAVSYASMKFVNCTTGASIIVTSKMSEMNTLLCPDPQSHRFTELLGDQYTGIYAKAMLCILMHLQIFD